MSLIQKEILRIVEEVKGIFCLFVVIVNTTKSCKCFLLQNIYSRTVVTNLMSVDPLGLRKCFDKALNLLNCLSNFWSYFMMARIIK